MTFPQALNRNAKVNKTIDKERFRIGCNTKDLFGVRSTIARINLDNQCRKRMASQRCILTRDWDWGISPTVC
jgi:hypothetical protein